MTSVDRRLFAQLDNKRNNDNQRPDNVRPVPSAFGVDDPGKQRRRENIGNQQQQYDKALIGHDGFPVLPMCVTSVLAGQLLPVSGCPVAWFQVAHMPMCLTPLQYVGRAGFYQSEWWILP